MFIRLWIFIKSSVAGIAVGERKYLNRGQGEEKKKST